MVHQNTIHETAPHLNEKTLSLLIKESEEEMMQIVRTIEITINPEIIAILITLVVKTQENIIAKTDLIVQESNLKVAEIHIEIRKMIAVEGPLKKPIEFEVASLRQSPHSVSIHQVEKKEIVLEIQVRKWLKTRKM